MLIKDAQTGCVNFSYHFCTRTVRLGTLVIHIYMSTKVRIITHSSHIYNLITKRIYHRYWRAKVQHILRRIAASSHFVLVDRGGISQHHEKFCLFHLARKNPPVFCLSEMSVHIIKWCRRNIWEKHRFEYNNNVKQLFRFIMFIINRIYQTWIHLGYVEE